MNNTNSNMPRYILYLIFYAYRCLADWPAWERYNPEINQLKHTFCYMHCPDDIDDIVEYFNKKIADYYRHNSGYEHQVIIYKQEKIDQEKGKIIPRVFEVIYGLESKYTIKEKKDMLPTLYHNYVPASIKKKIRASMYDYLQFTRDHHPGIVNRIIMLIHEDDHMTDDNIEEVILNKIPDKVYQKKYIKLISVKEHIKSNQ